MTTNTTTMVRWSAMTKKGPYDASSTYFLSFFCILTDDFYCNLCLKAWGGLGRVATTEMGSRRCQTRHLVPRYVFLLDWPRSGSEPFEPGSNPNPNLMFGVWFIQIIEPEPKRRFGFGVSANLNIRLRTLTFFPRSELGTRRLFCIHSIIYAYLQFFLRMY